MKKLYMFLFFVVAGLFACVSCANNPPISEEGTQVLTDQQYFELYCTDESTWTRKSGGLTIAAGGARVPYYLLLTSNGPQTEFCIKENQETGYYLYYYYDAESFASDSIAVTPSESSPLTGTLSSFDSTQITYSIDKTTGIMTITRGSETVVFELQEDE